MPLKNLNDLNVFTTIVVGLFGVWGAFLNYIRRHETQKDLTKNQKISYFFTDFASSTGLAMLTYIALQGWGVNELLSVACAGFVSHQGTRAIYVAQIVIAEKLGLNRTIDAIKEEHEKENK
jgi:L-serine deaminase